LDVGDLLIQLARNQLNNVDLADLLLPSSVNAVERNDLPAGRHPAQDHALRGRGIVEA
jgi:hypothetical protein